MPVNGSVLPWPAAGVAGGGDVCCVDGAAGVVCVGGVNGAFGVVFVPACPLGAGVVVGAGGVVAGVVGAGELVAGIVVAGDDGTVCVAGTDGLCGIGVWAAGVSGVDVVGGISTCCCPYWSAAAEVGSSARAAPAQQANTRSATATVSENG
jgi:hypothetical protein